MLRPTHRFLVRLALLASLLTVSASVACAARIVTWNLLAYDEVAAHARRNATLTVLPSLNPDVMIVQELLTAPAADSFAAFLRTSLPGKRWIGGSSTFLLTTQSALYYDSLQFSHSNLTALNAGGPRQILVALLRPQGYKANAASFRLYSMHFKAGNGAGGTSPPSDSALRTTECTNLRNNLNLAPAGTNIMLGGDSNFYGSFETGYTRLTESQADNDGRLKDPLSMTGLWNNLAYAPHLTQSPCSGTGCVGSNGGLDDRFDLFLSTYSLSDGLGLDLVPGGLANGYGAFGNDGFHYNQAVDAADINYAVPIEVARALKAASDHLPVVATLQLPAKIATPLSVSFGDVIIGGGAYQTLFVDNLPPPPAATLTYSLTAPTGFTAPTGTFSNAATSAAAGNTIAMATTSLGTRSGTLTVNSNDLDSTVKTVALSGRVLAHAAPSFDSLTTALRDTIDFGVVSSSAGTQFRTYRVFNRPLQSLQARMFWSAPIVVGDARFTAPTLDRFPIAADAVGSLGAVYFDPTGLPSIDIPFTAEVRIPTADENLPGATALDTLRLTLIARAPSGLAVDDVPRALRFAPPAPNPLRDEARFAFDLPSEASVQLAVYDASGRLVETLADGRWPAGRHQVRWSARGTNGGTRPAGLYFARFTTPGLTRVARLVLLP